MSELVAELARRLVDEPDAVRVEEVEEEDGTLVLRLHVAEADIGKVIGRQGRLARALRTIVRAGGGEAGRPPPPAVGDRRGGCCGPLPHPWATPPARGRPPRGARGTREPR